ncbi:hypothetical protein [Streptomyces boncukensis]|uniref:Secreted protein n=1 Tax=Streptomyces boncukensis TaxID=2711219 RepID=A0A6G4WVR4_9ACTN|nr:hypothetical protein [Streptomyces boncukensis]NGO69379.1 hypothetical protein [Streptomyces boncukensis]
MKKARMAIVGVATVSATALAGPAAAVADSASSHVAAPKRIACSKVYKLKLSNGNGYMKYRKCKVLGKKRYRMHGFVRDTRVNGKPVYGKAIFKRLGGGYHTHTYKTYGYKKFNTGWHNARWVKGALRG